MYRMTTRKPERTSSRRHPRQISARAASAEVTLRFPPAVSARQRAILHAVAEANGVPHASAGDGEGRSISLGSGARVVEVLPEDVTHDEALCALLAEHLRVSPEASRLAFAAPAPRGDGRDRASRSVGEATVGSSFATSPASASAASVDVAAFVRRTLELLELEREAEEEQGEAILRGMRPETAQKKGRALLGLKCVDVRGGFYGKTIVTLELASRGSVNVSQSGALTNGGGKNSGAPPLPPHKLTPHDIVAIKANKGEPGGDPLCAGVVYRVRDAQIEIAIDEAPEALDGTLRLERLANETSHKRLVDAVRDVGKVGEGGAGVDLGRFPGARLVEVLFGSTRPRFANARSATPRGSACVCRERGRRKDRSAFGVQLGLERSSGRRTRRAKTTLCSFRRSLRITCAEMSREARGTRARRARDARTSEGRRPGRCLRCHRASRTALSSRTALGRGGAASPSPAGVDADRHEPKTLTLNACGSTPDAPGTRARGCVRRAKQHVPWWKRPWTPW